MYQDHLSFVQNYPNPEGIWELVEKIGEGNYGVVFKGRNKKTGKIGAVKIIDAVLDKEEDIQAELNVFEKYSAHDNIVECYGLYLKKQDNAIEQLWIVMECCSGGSVTDLVKKMKEKGESLSEDIVAYILREVLSGLIYLHNNNVIHRDIKGQNVLMTNDGRIRLIDFGISAVVDHAYGRRRTAIGTPYWMSPEVIACEHQLEYEYDSRCDIWSLGITAIEICEGTPPLFGENPIRALYKIPKNPPPKLQYPTKWSRHLNDFIAKCLVKDFERRPTSHQLAQTDLIVLVPKDARMLRRKIMAILDNYVLTGSDSLLSDHSNSTSSVSTCMNSQENTLKLKTIELVNDLATLEYIDEGVIVGQLMKRYSKGLIYTYVGDILISINPFQQLPNVYHDKVSKQYRGITKTSKGHLPPHIFAVAGSAYQGMLRESKDQCCVISGESGAGKTEASNILVQQFMQIGRAKNNTLENKILSLNPLLESFGNARTIINNNSSRFGKYLELNFTHNGQIVGAHLSEYLLEKSRVISQGGRERNFHIFYYLLAGLGERNLLRDYKLKKGHHFRYLRQIGTGKATGKQNQGFAEKFDQVETAFYTFGFTKQEFNQICSILAGILNIGEIHIEENIHSIFHMEEVSIIKNHSLLDKISELLKINSTQFESIIISSRVMTHGETIIRPNSVEQAMDYRDAIAKSLYGRLFSWIVSKVNPSLNPSKDRHPNLLNIGLLDIFGFENLRTNSFEQLCINITNEQLQFYFNQHVFAWEQEEYEREGINMAHIGYTDNRPLLELLLSRPMGLLALLDEESKFPRATDATLATKFHQNLSSSANYFKPKDNGPTFIIFHYAGSVLYETQGFLEKNRDSLKPEVISLMRESENSILQQLYTFHLSSTGNLTVSSISKVPTSATPLFNRRGPAKMKLHVPMRTNTNHTPLSNSVSITTKHSQTVSTYFFYSLRELMAKMLLGTPHFVRCIRPNDLKTPSEFHQEKVIEQLRYTGVLETTRIRREGYSHRILFEDFLQRYHIISYPLSQYVAPTPVNCIQILMQAGLEKWEIGKTKVFLKYFHIDRLWHLLSNYHHLARKIQNFTRCWLARREIDKLKKERAAVRIQSVVRGFIARQQYKKTLNRRNKAAVVLQKNIRGFLCRVRYQRNLINNKAAIVIQSIIRMWLCRKKYSENRLCVNMAAKIIQRSFRKWSTARHEREITEHNSALIIQKAIKKYLQKQVQTKHLEKQMKSHTVDTQYLTSGLKQGSLRSKLEHHVIATVQEMDKRLNDEFFPVNYSSHSNNIEVIEEHTEPFKQPHKVEKPYSIGYSIKDTLEEHTVSQPKEKKVHFVSNPTAVSDYSEKAKRKTEQDTQNSMKEFTKRIPLSTSEIHKPQDKQALVETHKPQNKKIPLTKEIENKEKLITETPIKQANGQAQRFRKFFEELTKQNQPVTPHSTQLQPKPRLHYPIERITKRSLHSEMFRKLLEHFDSQ